jgi:uncharacterized protein YjiS (DUF1127 family)
MTQEASMQEQISQPFLSPTFALPAMFTARTAIVAAAESRKRSLRDVLSALTALPLVWQQRAFERFHLRCIDDRLLRDMGMTRQHAEREASKPFWRK